MDIFNRQSFSKVGEEIADLEHCNVLLPYVSWVYGGPGSTEVGFKLPLEMEVNETSLIDFFEEMPVVKVVNEINKFIVGKVKSKALFVLLASSYIR